MIVLAQTGEIAMVLSNQKQAKTINKTINPEFKFNPDDVRPLQHHELDHVSGGRTPPYRPVPPWGRG